MKKFLSFLTAAAFSVSMYAFAADEPPIMAELKQYDGSSAISFGNIQPDGSNIVIIPEENGSFEYSFAKNTVQYSDFIIVPSTNTVNLLISLVGEGETDVMVTLMNGYDEIYSAVVTVDDSEVELCVPFYDLGINKVYYIKLEAESINGSRGTLRIEGRGKKSDGEEKFAAEEDFEYKVNELKEYNIIQGDENGDLRLDDYITRAEAAALMCRLINADCNSVKNIFADVESDFWAAKYITAAYQTGLAWGDEDSLFHPNDSLTIEDAVKMMISAVGYDPLAQRRGEYPNGYIMQAAQMGLLNGISIKVGESIKRRDMMRIAHAALDIPILQLQVSTDGTHEYRLMDGKKGIPLITLRTILAEKE